MLIYICMSLMFMMMMMFIGLVSMNMSSWFISFKWFFFLSNWDSEFYFSKWTILSLYVVLFISLMVMLFTYSYMSMKSVKNFLFLYILFVCSMAWVILVSNFYWMMLGWDGLGVVSFLLIMYYQNYESSTNASSTLSQNRVGDFFFIYFLVLSMTGYSFDFSCLTGLSVLLIFGASVKSAQFPFNSWLLAAMSAPTPISSLVHSSTLVVAGVYILLLYSYCLFEYLYVVFWLSMTTLVYSFFGLMVESDMKKLIAYSTMSHVGLMMLFYSQMLFKITYFHLVVHAMFKSMMFMSFGFCMLLSYHSQDYRLVSYYSFYPSVKFMYFYACVCMMGIPFLSAFFSKDFMVEKLMEWSVDSFVLIFLLCVFLGVSVLYSMRLLCLVDMKYVLSFHNSFSVSGWSLLGMVLLSVGMINVSLSLVFSLSLEFLSMKSYIYLMIGLFLIIFKILTSFKKWWSFEKFMWIKEIFSLNLYYVDVYVFNILEIYGSFVVKFLSVKLILLCNRWVLLSIIYLY